MPTPEQLSMFSGPALQISDADKKAMEMAALQKAFAQQQAEMQADVAKTTQIDDNKAILDVMKQEPTANAVEPDAVLPALNSPQGSMGQSEVNLKDPKEKLFDVPDLIPMILGAIMGGALGGPGGALAGAAGGFFKGQEGRKKNMLERLKLANANEIDRANLSFRERQLQSEQAERDRQFDLDKMYKQGMLSKTGAAKDTRTAAQKNLEYRNQLIEQGATADQLAQFDKYAFPKSSAAEPTEFELFLQGEIAKKMGVDPKTFQPVAPAQPVQPDVNVIKIP